MQFILDKIPSRMFLFTRKPTNSAGHGARQSVTDSAQHVDQIRTLSI